MQILTLLPSTGCISSSQIISVAASTYHDTLATFSNYGTSSVDLAAPGVSIYSATKAGGYSYLNSASMAVPYVTGTAALLKARNPSISTPQMKSKILGSCDVLASLSGKVATGGRLNAAKALDVSIPTPTPTITPVPTVTHTPTPSPTPTFTPVPTVTRTPTPSPTPTFTPSPTQGRSLRAAFIKRYPVWFSQAGTSSSVRLLYSG